MRMSLVGLMLISVFSCRPQGELSSRVKIAPADRNAKNVAFIVGSPNDLSGVDRDIAEVSAMIKQADFGYEVVVINRATASQVLSNAEEIGRKLSENSTVFFYYSGHGSADGYLITEGLQTLRLSTIAKRIGKGYGKGKFKRFIAVMDSCYSGQNINGREQMFLTSQQNAVQETLHEAVDNMASDMKPKANPNLPFEQALLLAAAQSNEESLDFGPSVGGAFTASWRKILSQDLKKEGVSIGALLEETRAETRRRTGGSHTPVWKAMPESLLTEKLVATSTSDVNADDIFMALGDASDGAMMFTSIPVNVSVGAIEICKGDKIACSTGSAPKLATFVNASDLKIENRAVFRSEKSIALAHSDVLTVVVRDASGRSIGARSVTVKRK